MALFQNKYRIESSRLKGWDYTTPGLYFVTICTQYGPDDFGYIADDAMHLSHLGKIASKYWEAIPEHSPPGVDIDAYSVMPDHVHGIIVLACRDVACNVSTPPHISPKRGSLGAIVRSYKSAVTDWARKNAFPGFRWQARYHDHIIRSEGELESVRNYILGNPAKWESDRDKTATRVHRG